MSNLDTNSNLWPVSPIRPVDWRSQRALQLALQEESEDSPDPFILALLSIYRGEGVVPAIARDCLADVQAAQQLRLRNRPLATEIEARILARQSSTTIAEMLGIEEKIVEAYTKCYFDVGDHLEATMYITFKAIFSRGSLADPAVPQEAFLRWLGYAGGPIALNAILPSYAQVSSWLSPRTEHSMILPRTQEARILWRMRAIFRLWVEEFGHRLLPSPTTATTSADQNHALSEKPVSTPLAPSHAACLAPVETNQTHQANLVTTLESDVCLPSGTTDQNILVTELLELSGG